MEKLLDRLTDAATWVVVGLGVVGTYLFGTWDSLVQVLIAFVVFDFITGWASAPRKEGLDSRVGLRGIALKIGLFTVVAMGHLMDGVLSLNPPLLRTVAIWFYIANEGLSILENLGEAGVKIPSAVKGALTQLRDKAEGGSQ